MALSESQIIIGVGCLLVALVCLYCWYQQSKSIPAQTIPATVTTQAGTTPATLSIPETPLGKDGSAIVPVTVQTATTRVEVPMRFTKGGMDFSSIDLSCPSGNIIIQSADYAGVDNAKEVAALCNGHQSCVINVLPSSMRMDNGQVGSLQAIDPYPKIKKSLWVNYTCQ